MRRVAKHLSAIAGRVLFIGFSVQIAFGLVWMLCNFGVRQNFVLSGAGILYPVLLWLAHHYCILYVLQVIVALWTGYFFLKTIHPSFFWNIWGSFAILTVPMGMQCHLALLPNSLINSLMLMECALFWRATIGPKKEQGAENKPMRMAENRTVLFAGMALCWLLMALLDELYFYFGGILPLVLLLVTVCGRERFRIVPLILLFSAFAGIIFGLYDLAKTTGSYEKEQKRVAEMLFDRFVWSTTLRDWGACPQALKDFVPEEIIVGASYYADGLVSDLEPILSQILSQEEMDALFTELAQEAWRLYPKRIIHECGWDLAGYVFSPTITGLMLQGRGCISYCLRNYDIMSRETPKLTRYYVDYACWWFSVAFCLAVFLEVFTIISAGRLPSGRKLGCLVAFAVACGCPVLWYVMQGAGIMDYKRTIFITGLWIAWQIQKAQGEWLKF